MITRTSVSILACGIVGAALAGNGDGVPNTPDFTKVDRDGDGVISRQEAKSFPDLEKLFSSADADQDGKLKASEFRAARYKLES